MESFRFVVYGKVQGVFYRKFVAEKLRRLGVRGYVRNLPDGSVEVVVRATEEELEEIRRILEEGSPLSKVERIEMEALEEDDLLYEGFEIRY
jgi:acylphosphatase